MLLKEVFEKSVQFFKDKKINTPRLDVELLLAHVLKIDRIQLYVKYEQPLKDDEVNAFREFVRRRASGEPVAYIMNEKGFYGELFSVGAGVLIPRPETETIVEEALKFIKKNNLAQPRVLDLGAGSGCIGLSILKNNPEASLISYEKSPDAFKYLQQNTTKLGLEGRATLKLADIEQIDFSTASPFDLILSNPPYIAQDDPQVELNVRKFEPAQALFAEDQGLALVKSWIEKTAGLLKSPGILLFEIGSTQGAAVKEFALSQKLFSEVQIIKDLSGLDRTLKCVR